MKNSVINIVALSLLSMATFCKAAEPIQSAEQLDRALQSGKIVVVYFSSSTCQPCKMFHPHYEALAQEFPGIMFIEIRYGVTQNAAVYVNKYGIKSFPALIIFDKTGTKVGQAMTGYNEGRKAEIARILKALLEGITPSCPVSMTSTVVSKSGSAPASSMQQKAAPAQPMKQQSMPMQKNVAQAQSTVKPAPGMQQGAKKPMVQKRTEQKKVSCAVAPAKKQSAKKASSPRRMQRRQATRRGRWDN